MEATSAEKSKSKRHFVAQMDFSSDSSSSSDSEPSFSTPSRYKVSPKSREDFVIWFKVCVKYKYFESSVIVFQIKLEPQRRQHRTRRWSTSNGAKFLPPDYRNVTGLSQAKQKHVKFLSFLQANV